ncbi:MAG: FecR family protein, partial [Flavitalea sp.]
MQILNERVWILLAKKKAGEASPEDLAELASFLSADTTSGYTNEIIDKIWEAPVVTIPETSIQGNVWGRIEKKTTGISSFPIFRSFASKQWMAAASIVLALSAVIVLYAYFNRPATTSALAHYKNVSQVATQPGSKSKLELPDGTLVWLNGDSKLSYSNGGFGKDNREVILAGEAFFDVVKNEKIPFIIHTGPINITVKGTAFNVKAYPKEKTIETSLVRGLIEITTEQDPERKILLKPNEKIIIPVDEARNGLRPQELADSTEGPLYSITK